jgi:23S rRNA (uracil1939-C5)-methyltransferase
MSKEKHRIELHIDSLAAGGDGVGRSSEGRVTFVPGAAPGDKVLVELMQEKKQFARGRIIKLLQASEERREPRCKFAKNGRCGGCQWQHVSERAQGEAKSAMIAKSLRHAISRGVNVHPLQNPCTPYKWRRRTRLSFWASKDKRFLGFYPPKSRFITDIAQCPQLEEGLQEALGLVRQHLLPGLRGRGEVEILLGTEGRSHVVVHGQVATQAMRDLEAEPAIAGVKSDDVVVGETSVELEGGIQTGADQFAQASRAGNEALCECVAQAVGSLAGMHLLELFAGRGNFTRLFAEAARVVAVEVAGVASMPNVEWLQSDAKHALASLGQAKERFDVVVLDPPRTGAKEELAGIAALSPQKIVYISCDPATLARDIEQLHELGYEARDVFPLDLMPQTSHVEMVAVLTRRA